MTATVIRSHTSATSGRLLFESVHLADCPDLADSRGARGVTVREHRYDCGPLEALRRRRTPRGADVACTCVRAAAVEEGYAEEVERAVLV